MYAKYIEQDGRFAFSLSDNGGVEITDDDHADLIAAQSAGKLIVAQSDGYPVAVSRPTETQAAALARAIVDIRRERAPILDSLNGIASRAARASDTATASAADQAAVDLLDITTLPELLAATNYDGMKAAVLARYHDIAASSPVVVQSAFRGVFAS